MNTYVPVFNFQAHFSQTELFIGNCKRNISGIFSQLFTHCGKNTLLSKCSHFLKSHY